MAMRMGRVPTQTTGNHRTGARRGHRASPAASLAPNALARAAGADYNARRGGGAAPGPRWRLPCWSELALADWKSTTRYYPFSQFLRENFGCRVRKITVDGGFTCPNRDGTVGSGGCAYCVNRSFSPAVQGGRLSVREQVARGIQRIPGRRGDTKFIAYFQPFTNTYAELPILRQRYDEALEHEAVVGLAIGTRPDCVPDEVLDLVQSYTSRCQVWLEYGLQSAHDHTLDRINRGHHWAEFEDAVARTRGRGIYVCAHVILGLPGETPAHMRQTAERTAALGIDGIKLHHLAIVKGSRLEQSYRHGEITMLDCEQYVSVTADFLERLPATAVVQRLVGDTYGDLLVAPVWWKTKPQIIAAITAELRRRGSHQGALRENAARRTPR